MKWAKANHWTYNGHKPEKGYGDDEKIADMKNWTWITGLLTSNIIVNQNCKFKYCFFLKEKIRKDIFLWSLLT